jgi:DNA primase
LSPLRDEKHPLFKVDRAKNVWYDHGIGKGGSLVDFLMEMHQCDVSKAMQKISFFHPQNMVKNSPKRPRFYLHENSLIFIMRMQAKPG